MRISLLVLMLLAGARGGTAQVQIPRETRCTECRIRLEQVATLAGDHVLGAPRSIVRTGDGRFIVTFYPTSDEVLEFESSGRFKRVLAATGEGPGEVSSAGAMHLIEGDSLRIYDRGRTLTFTPEGEFAYSEPLAIPAVNDAEAVGPRRAVVNSGTFMPGSGPAPLRLVEGRQVIGVFGVEDDLPVTPLTPELMVRSVTTDRRGRVWSAGLTRYQIREWTREGELIRTWTRPVPWFEPWTTLTAVSAEAAPAARLLAIQWLGSERLLVLLATPGDDWRSHLGPSAVGRGGRTIYPEADFARMFRSRLEVLDLESGVVLATSQDVPEAITIVDHSHVAGYRQDELGNPFIDIWRFEFTSR
jgi:hypothetical protein